MRTLKTSEAAALLDVSHTTLRAWERRFGYPMPQRSAGRHRLYAHGEVMALRDGLQQGLSISAAISHARRALSSDTGSLLGALATFELERADRAMESALALRSVEDAVEEVLLGALDDLARRYGPDSAPWAFAARWADGWLRRAQRLAPPPARRMAILIGDATDSELGRDAIAVRALELFCARSAAHVTVLPVGGIGGLSGVVRSLSIDAVVIAGGDLPDEAVALWAYRVRSSAGPLPMALFRRANHAEPIHSTGSPSLPDSPSGAHRQLLNLITGSQATQQDELVSHSRHDRPPNLLPRETGALHRM